MSNRTVKMIVGLEVHVQLKTRTKLFCGCRTSFGDEPNSHCCPVCLGLPGVLPVMNREAYRLSVVTALALHCDVATFTKWDRKHYYYPDLPKNYQISQYDLPLGAHGYLEIETEQNGGKDKPVRTKIRVLRTHLEEDAGKLLHAEHGGTYSMVDLNRTGTPLLEIVSEPDMTSVDEVRAYCTGLRQLVTYLGVSEANMQMGHMRFEPNINLHITENGQTFKTPIVELKNLNSFRSVERAVAYEERRQLVEWEETGRVQTPGAKTTRGWNDTAGETFVQREKEEAHDYRYFPEPDLVVVEPETKWIDEIRGGLPELPMAKRDRFIKDYGLSEYDAGVLAATIEMARYFERVVELSGAPKTAANWVTQGLTREINTRNLAINTAEDFPVTAGRLAELVKAVQEGTISKTSGDAVLTEMIDAGKSAPEIIAARGLAQVSDTSALEKMVEDALAANPGPVADYKAGKKQSLGRIMGFIMKASGGKANPKVVSQMLEKKLNE
jgi:aspartyl-tRNA(Asn)/glutamyl-tRNA(Gln) amidotransferase subunit B